MTEDTGTEGQVGHQGDKDGSATRVAVPGVGAVNGPEDEITDWPSIHWRQVEDDVRRLRQRIFTASKAACPRAFGACLSRVR